MVWVQRIGFGFLEVGSVRVQRVSRCLGGSESDQQAQLKIDIDLDRLGDLPLFGVQDIDL